MKHVDTLPEEVAGKLKSLVALAHRTKGEDLQGEHEAAMAAALRLAERYNVDLDSIDPEDASKVRGGLEHEEFVNRKFKVAKGDRRRPPCHSWVAWILTEYFHVELVYCGSTVWVVGRKSRAEVAEFLYFHLVRSFNALWRSAKARDNLVPSERASYFYGLYEGLKRKLDRARKDAKDETQAALVAAGAANDCQTLVLIKETERLKQASKGYHPVVVQRRGSPGGDVWSDRATDRGRTDGAAITITQGLNTNQKEQLT